MYFPSSIKVFKLNNGITIPAVGLGVYQLPPGQKSQKLIDNALKNGYRHIDTAAIYRNEETVGDAIRSSLIPRNQIFVTTKLWNSDHGYDHALRAFDKSLERLKLDYIDLFLIHWPVQGKRKETWKALEKLYKDGKVKAIGVSNYMKHHLEELLGYADVAPAVNQIELHPYVFASRSETIDFCRASGILPVAYSPLTKGIKLTEPVLIKTAAKYRKSTAQLLIRWALQQGFCTIPKSATLSRVIENNNVFDFEISENDMETLNKLDENLVTGWDPTDTT
ncbi:MAG: aldo/keto reductase [Lentimicrobium sp.]|nr:aldo/keto reductase [Lentimicrobium sp.]